MFLLKLFNLCITQTHMHPLLAHTHSLTVTHTHTLTVTHTLSLSHTQVVQSKSPKLLRGYCGLESLHEADGARRGWGALRSVLHNEPVVVAEVQAQIVYNPRLVRGCRWATIIHTSTFRIVPNGRDLEHKVRIPVLRQDPNSEQRWQAAGLKALCWDEYVAYTTVVPS